jgi:hypothetical protein
VASLGVIRSDPQGLPELLGDIRAVHPRIWKGLWIEKENPLPELEDNVTRARRIAPDGVALAALALALLLFYWGYLIGRHFIWDDTLMEFYPGVNYFAASIHAGRFPLWFPGVHDGQPFYSDPQLAVFYPPQWILIPFVEHGRLPFVAYERYIVLHYLFGGLFTYAFLRQLKLIPIAALIGALVFCLSGFASLHIANIVLIQVYIWLPLQLLCVHRLTQRRDRWAWLGLVGAMLMSLLAGHQQTTVYGSYLVIGYWLYRCYCGRRGAGLTWSAATSQTILKDAPRLIGTCGLVLGLGAVMLIPAVENWSRTSRAHQSFENVADLSLPYHQLVTLLVPNFFGKTVDGDAPVAFWGYDPHRLGMAARETAQTRPGFWQYWEFGAYPGVIFWLAVCLILFNWRRVEDKRTVGFFLMAWVFATWFMLGRYGGLLQVLARIIPGAGLFRGPAKMSCVATFAAVILSGYAVHLLSRRPPRMQYWPVLVPVACYSCVLLALLLGEKHFAGGLRDADKLEWAQNETCFALAVAAVCALAAVAGVRSRSGPWQLACLYAMAAVSIADFYRVYGGFQCGRYSPDEYYPTTNHLFSVLEQYRAKLGPFRFGQIRDGQLTEELATHRNQPCFQYFLEVPEGYTSFFADNVARFQAITNQEARFGIQNIQAVVTSQAGPHGEDWLTVSTNLLPRARFYRTTRVYNDRAELLGALERDRIDWRSEAAVCRDSGAWGGGAQGGAGETNDAIRFVSHTPEEYCIEYNIGGPGIVFVSEAFYPGWVTDNPRMKLTEVFGAFQGIWMPEAGFGRVTVRFSPWILKMSIVITVLSVLVTVLVSIFGKWGGSTATAD